MGSTATVASALRDLGKEEAHHIVFKSFKEGVGLACHACMIGCPGITGRPPKPDRLPSPSSDKEPELVSDLKEGIE